MIGKLRSYPIPELRLPAGEGKTFLDLGCNWGRWSIAAARKGYAVIGVDPSLGAVMAARRVAERLGLPIRHVVADARFLPFPSSSFDVVFSYSVLQHLSKTNVRTVVDQVARTLKAGGVSFIQMPNFLGIRSLQHQARRGFREPCDFEVRYWSLPELTKAFSRIGTTAISVDCYFGLGLQESDVHLMPPHLKLLIRLSAVLRQLTGRLPFLKYVADSVYVRSVHEEQTQERMQSDLCSV
jgi:SAM-dependent methyltransferase